MGSTLYHVVHRRGPLLATHGPSGEVYPLLRKAQRGRPHTHTSYNRQEICRRPARRSTSRCASRLARRFYKRNKAAANGWLTGCTLSALLASSPPCLTNNLSGPAAVLCERREAGVSDQTLAVRDQCEEPDRSNRWPRMLQREPRCAGDSSGNTIGKYWALRALAAFSGARVLILRACPAPFTHGLPGELAARGGAARRAGAHAKSQPAALSRAVHHQHPSRARMLDEGLWMQRDWWYPFLFVAHELRAASRRTRRRRHLQLDDAVVYVRLGDALTDRSADKFGIFTFTALEQLIPPDVRSIGVITQHNPHAACDRRGRASSVAIGRSRCDCASSGGAPAARLDLSCGRPAKLTVRHSEPVMASWAAAALAPAVTICPPSTFCLWPTLAAARGFTPASLRRRAPRRARTAQLQRTGD